LSARILEAVYYLNEFLEVELDRRHRVFIQ
jgi:hypothetical protein